MTDPTDDADEADVPDPWEQTIAEMRELAAEREADGWETVTVQAGHTAPEPPEAGDSDRFGLVYTAPGDVADEFREIYEDRSFDSYTVYRRQIGQTLFLVTEIADTDGRAAVFLAGGVDLAVADELIEAAREAGELRSHVQLLDWTHLGSFRHEDPSDFFPELA